MVTNGTRLQPYEHLRDISFFRGCTDKELRLIDQLVFRVHAESGSVLCREGEHGRQTFVIIEGEVAVSIDGVVVAHLGSGSLFGEMSVIDASPRCATVTAMTDLSALALAPQELGSLMEIPAVLPPHACHDVEPAAPHRPVVRRSPVCGSC